MALFIHAWSPYVNNAVDTKCSLGGERGELLQSSLEVVGETSVITLLSSPTLPSSPSFPVEESDN